MTTSAVHTPRGPVTRKDVTGNAGVSTAVVSHVVNGAPKMVVPATEPKIQNIRTLDRRLNAAASVVNPGSVETIGLIIPDNSTRFSSLAHAVQEAAAEFGYAMVLMNSDGSPAKERQNIRNLAARQVDGILLSSVLRDPDLADLRSSAISAVLVDRERASPDFNSVGVDLAAGARRGVEHLIRHGHTNIGLAIGSHTHNDFDGREVGWFQALAAAGLPPGPVVRSASTCDGGYSSGRKLLALPNRPTAVFASSDMQAIGILRAIHEAGLSVPGNIALAAFDGSEEAKYTWPALTTVERPVRALAVAAVQALVGEGRNRESRHQSFPTDLRIRQSCGCPGS